MSLVFPFLNKKKFKPIHNWNREYIFYDRSKSELKCKGATAVNAFWNLVKNNKNKWKWPSPTCFFDVKVVITDELIRLNCETKNGQPYRVWLENP